jgi:hypothetical protein
MKYLLLISCLFLAGCASWEDETDENTFMVSRTTNGHHTCYIYYSRGHYYAHYYIDGYFSRIERIDP